MEVRDGNPFTPSLLLFFLSIKSHSRISYGLVCMILVLFFILDGGNPGLFETHRGFSSLSEGSSPPVCMGRRQSNYYSV